MPKLTNRPPQYKKSGKYAVVYIDGKRIFLGPHGSQESKVAYARCLAERESPGFSPPKGEQGITVKEVAAAFLDHAKEHYDTTPTIFTGLLSSTSCLNCTATISPSMILSPVVSNWFGRRWSSHAGFAGTSSTGTPAALFLSLNGALKTI